MSTSQYGGWQVEVGYEEFVVEAEAYLTAIADEIMDGISEATVRHSTLHPNGFLVTHLENSAKRQVRLHIWPTGTVPELVPHSHPWHLASVVLAGTYIEYLPTVKMEQPGTHDLMVPFYNEAREQVGVHPAPHRVVFDLGEPRLYHAGELHFLPAGAFHATPLPVDQSFITLVQTGPQLYDMPSFVERNIDPNSVFERRNPTPEEAEAIWESLQLAV